MDDGVVVDAPPTNRWAIAGLVVAGLVAVAAFFALPVLQDAGLSVEYAILVIGAIEAAAGLACVFFVMHLHPADAEVERY